MPFCDQAISEGLKDGVMAKLASGAAAMFAGALKVHMHMHMHMHSVRTARHVR